MESVVGISVQANESVIILTPPCGEVVDPPYDPNQYCPDCGRMIWQHEFRCPCQKE